MEINFLRLVNVVTLKIFHGVLRKRNFLGLKNINLLGNLDGA